MALMAEAGSVGISNIGMSGEIHGMGGNAAEAEAGTTGHAPGSGLLRQQGHSHSHADTHKNLWTTSTTSGVRSKCIPKRTVGVCRDGMNEDPSQQPRVSARELARMDFEQSHARADPWHKAPPSDDSRAPLALHSLSNSLPAYMLAFELQETVAIHAGHNCWCRTGRGPTLKRPPASEASAI